MSNEYNLRPMTEAEKYKNAQVDRNNAKRVELTEEEINAGYPDCDKCGNKRYIYYFRWYGDVGYYTDSVGECDCMKYIRSLENIKKSGLADVISRYKFKNFIARQQWQHDMKDKAIKYAEHIVNGGKAWFLALGQSGSGKTHICTAICNTLLRRGKSVRYFRWGTEAKRLKSIVNKPEYSTEIDGIMQSDIIYLDDVFKRRKGTEASDGDVKLAFELIDTALAEGKILIVSGEDTLMQLFSVDTAIAGRLKQSAGEYIVEIAGDDKNQRL